MVHVLIFAERRSSAAAPLGAAGGAPAGVRCRGTSPALPNLRAVLVAQVCPYSLSAPGGVQGQVRALARALRRLGHDVVVLGPLDGAPPEPGLRSVGRSVRVAANGSMVPLAPWPATFRRTLALLTYLRADVLHIHEPLVPGPALAALASSARARVGTFHRSGGSLGYALTLPAARLAAARLDQRFAVSPEAAATARVLGGTYEVLWNGVDLSPLASVERIERSGPTVLFVGRHERRKGLEVALEAFSRLPPGATLWVVGPGTANDELQRRYRAVSGVVFCGAVSEAEKWARLRAADVLVAPSLFGESFGVVLLEAMGAGAVVVGSDLPGYRRATADGEAALLVPAGDVDALAGALARALSDRVLASQLVTAGKRLAASFSIDRLAATYVASYRALLGG